MNDGDCGFLMSLGWGSSFCFFGGWGELGIGVSFLFFFVCVCVCVCGEGFIFFFFLLLYTTRFFSRFITLGEKIGDGGYRHLYIYLSIYLPTYPDMIYDCMILYDVVW